MTSPRQYKFKGSLVIGHTLPIQDYTARTDEKRFRARA